MPSRIRNDLVLTLAVVGLLTSGACGSGGPSPDASETATPIGLRGNIVLRGALTSKGDYDVSFSSATDVDCAGFAARRSSDGEAVSFIVPLPTRIGGDHLSWTAAVRPYRGPGRYGLRAMPGLRVAVVDDAGKPTRTFTSSARTVASADVTADGSGTFTFSNLGPQAGPLSGTARWTCDDG